ncbi:DUF433 domain-containing protein [Cupriavidus necator]|uniref:DUF433 domain-containing protein n=1 Tax=Cupriavidus necator TaxID=106590 RepID=A0A2P1DV01_CUPNE|nr:DUF433 domain-containing protein [Cupriavidus necator]
MIDLISTAELAGVSPVFAGTRVSIHIVLAFLDAGIGFDQVSIAYPYSSAPTVP